MSAENHPATMRSRGWVIVGAVRLCDDRIVLAGSFPDVADREDMNLTTATGEHRVASCLWTNGDIAVLVLAHGGVVVDARSTLARAATPDLRTDLPMCADDVGALLRVGLATLPPEARADLVQFLLDTCAVGRRELDPMLSHRLHLVRQTLRPKLSPTTIAKDGPRGISVEVIVAVSETTFYARGWIGYANEALTSVVAVSPEGSRAQLLETLYRFERRDVATFYGEAEDRTNYGFAAYFTLDAPSAGATGWLLEIVLDNGDAMEAAISEIVRDIEPARSLLVHDLQLERTPGNALRGGHLAPAITRVLERAQERVEVRRLQQYGIPPENPDVTIIVPLYRRVELLEHQLIQFAQDPEIFAADVLYVLDSPEQGDYLIGAADRLFRLYGVPFRVAVLSHNGGFSTANNIGASLARGRLLLLMNSDVFPEHPGWLHELTTFYDRTPGIGALGPKLVYEDESIQHAGMYFDRPLGATEWGNEHYFKGLHRSFQPAGVSRPVPAVTAACMLISAELYRNCGGLRGAYVQGDFEDSDLCLRLSAAGLQHWYHAGVELYHLEGQSYATADRIANGVYNRWLHSHLWNDQITVTMAEEMNR